MAGISGQIGWKSEATWNTLVTPDKFSPLLSESIKNDGGEVIRSAGIRAGRRLGHIHKRGVPIIGGDVTQELGNADIAALLHHFFGGVVTTGTGPYTHTYTMGSVDASSLTMQVGRPSQDGTVNPFTFGGVKIASGEIACSVGENAQLTATVSAASEASGTALASASYTSGWEPFVYTEGAVTLGGDSIVVDSFSIKTDNALRTDSKGIGLSTIRKQVGNGMRSVTVDLAMDFESRDQYDAFLADDHLTLVIALDNGTDSFTVTAKGFLLGESPTLDGPEVLKQSLSFEVESSTSDADAFTAVLVNGETSAA